MLQIVNSSLENPYKKSAEYQKKTQEVEVNVQGVLYYKKITYESQLSPCYRLALGALAILSTLPMIACCCENNKAGRWWKQATSGVDQRIILVKNQIIKEPLQAERSITPRVHFGEARVRVFDKNEAPANVANTNSINLHSEVGRVIDFDPNQERRIPRVSIYDTTIDRGKGLVSVHGTGKLFTDEEIVEKLPIIQRTLIVEDIYATFTQHMKPIIQQQGTRGCTAATAAMLIVEHNKKPNVGELLSRNLGTDDQQIRDLLKAGLVPMVKNAVNLQELQELIQKHGSAIVGISGKLGGHVIVVDEVSQDQTRIRLRDPYHGWEITVKADAFLKEWKGGKTIQILQMAI